MSNFSRRQFVMLMSAAAAGTAVAPMGLLNARRAIAQGTCNTASFTVPGFGTPTPKLPNNTKSLGAFANIPLITLPDKFQYTAISIRGDVMSDGAIVPGNHDGMAAFQGRSGNYILVRNHERSIGGSGTIAPNGKEYDSFTGGSKGGGTTTVEVDRNGQVVRHYVSLAGTIRNCAGGLTPWGSWISSEENVAIPTVGLQGYDARVTKKHGYNFEVPAELGQAVDPIPLVAMGRMNHEAVSVDPQSGYIFETEDRGDSAYYKFVPKVGKPNKFGDLQRGGDLYAMVIKPGQRSDCTGALIPTGGTNDRGGSFRGVDTRGLGANGSGSLLPFLGQPLRVEWVKLDDVDPAEDTLRYEALAKGAAVWYRGEGAWYHQGKHYWVCSNAGDAAEGQVWAYDPRTETVTLVVESTSENLLDGPDNITVARDGTLYLCEDGSEGTQGAPNASQRVIGVDASGGLFEFCRNIIPAGVSGNNAEFAGACFSQNGKYMYVNSQGGGITYCIWRTDNRSIALNGATA
ncbi:MAG: phosphatase [Leptolyngbya sp.]|nr:MAG: phosphatase [Leptolyngbya sp.]